MGKGSFSDDFKRNAVRQITDPGYSVKGAIPSKCAVRQTLTRLSYRADSGT